MIHFAQPQLLWLLLLLPLIAFWRGRKGAVAAVEFSSAEAARAVARETRSRVGRWLPALRLLAAALVILAIARPQLGARLHGSAGERHRSCLALDVSGSMQSLDFTMKASPSIASTS